MAQYQVGFRFSFSFLTLSFYLKYNEQDVFANYTSMIDYYYHAKKFFAHKSGHMSFGWNGNSTIRICRIQCTLIVNNRTCTRKTHTHTHAGLVRHVRIAMFEFYNFWRSQVTLFLQNVKEGIGYNLANNVSIFEFVALG